MFRYFSKISVGKIDKVISSLYIKKIPMRERYPNICVGESDVPVWKHSVRILTNFALHVYRRTAVANDTDDEHEWDGIVLDSPAV